MSAQRLHSGWRLGLIGLAWLAGVGWQLQLPRLTPWPVDPLLCLAGLLLMVLALRWPASLPTRLQRQPWWLWLLVLALLGAGSTGWRAQQRLAQRLPAALEGVDLLVNGQVIGLPRQGPEGLRFMFEVEQALSATGQVVTLPPLLSLGWYAGYDDQAMLDEPRADLCAGERWRLPLRLKRPHGLLNPHGHDLEMLWFAQGAGASGHVRELRGGQAATRLALARAWSVDGWRQSLRDAIHRQVNDVRVAGVLAALMVGDQGGIDRADWELFRQTGIAHLVSISGVHVTMFAWLAGALVGRAWRRWPVAMLWLPAPQAARWGGLLLAAAYAVLAGWGVPAQRTVLMLAAAALLRSLGLRWPWLLVLVLAAVLVTVLDPWALLQPGFWLSFCAVGLLLLSEPVTADKPSPGWRGQLRGHGRAQLVASLGLAPLSLVFFQQLSLVGLLANLVAIPLVTLLITPLALLGALWAPLWSMAGWAVQALVALLSHLANWPLAQWTAAAAPAWAVASGLLAALLGVLPLPWSLRWLALPLALPLLWPPLVRPEPGQFDLLAVDVGQGTAVLVRSRHHLLVYDSGPQYGQTGGGDAGAQVLLPLLRALGHRQIDSLMLSHRDSDHVGGAAALLTALTVGRLHSSLEDGHVLRQRDLPQQRCLAGQRWQWDGVDFEVLHPQATDYAGTPKPNTVSCVLRIQDSQGRSALLTGDLESAQEAALVRRLGSALKSDVLLVPHHGSKTSSSLGFLQAVQPQVAVVQAAYRSRYGHPAAEVMQRYHALAVPVVRSDDCGAWLWRQGQGQCQRDLARRYWHASPAAVSQSP